MGIEIDGVCYYYVSVSNGLYWEAFEAACLPGYEDELEEAILDAMSDRYQEDVAAAMDDYFDNRVPGETIVDYRDRMEVALEYMVDSVEAYYLDDDGLVANDEPGAQFDGASKEVLAEKLSLNGEPFKFFRTNFGVA